MRKTLSSSPTSVIFSLFPEEQMVDEEEDYSIDAWGQYQAAADTLRGWVVASFLCYLWQWLVYVNFRYIIVVLLIFINAISLYFL